MPRACPEYKSTLEYKAFFKQRRRAKARGIEFCFEFADWVSWWELKLGRNWFKLRGRYKGHFVMARKGDKGPYSPENVECVTVESNLEACRPNGRLIVGTDVNSCKLTEDQVRQIFYEPGTLKHIGSIYGINATAVGKIKRGDSWKHITSGLRESLCDG